MHALEGLKKLPDESVDMVMTSPPYWSLRDYGKHTHTIWGDDPNCKHKFKDKVTFKRHKGGKNSQVGNNRKELTAFTNTSEFCSKCSAWKGQLGLEPSIDLFIEHMITIFDEVKRVLKKTGTCWVNFGDSYWGSGNASGHTKDTKQFGTTPTLSTGKVRGKKWSNDYPNKAMCMIPFRFAIEMANRGWLLRNTIIWHKPNCMPSSARDRFTVDFEYLFFFTKSKNYYFEKQFEPLQKDSLKRGVYPHKSNSESLHKKQCDGNDMCKFINPQGRNKRCVWTITTKPLKEAHFAVYPEQLCETPIKAGCPTQVCKKCGSPKLIIQAGGNSQAFNIRIRDVKNNRVKHTDRKVSNKEVHGCQEGQYISKPETKQILGCQCNAGFKPGVVLDPFIGSGTTALAAKKLGRNFIGFELNPEYMKISDKRLKSF